MSWKVIDISRYQGEVDFSKVKNEVDGIILRAGIGSYDTGVPHEDALFQTYVEQCIKYSIPFGFYYFSQSKNEAETITEANFLIDRAKKYNPQLPLVYDIESAGRINDITTEQRTSNCLTFYKTIQKAGYKCLVYTYKSFFKNQLNEQKLKDNNVERWIAHYTSTDYGYDKEYAMWQYTSTGSVNGISGNVDINHCYRNYFGGAESVAEYVPRLTAPSETDKNWIGIDYGGYNNALVINLSSGSVLPNCVGYVNGRWIELGVDPMSICVNNANAFWTHKDNFGRGQTPKLGAILCWDSSKCGHVAVVEKINSDGTVLASQSNYGGTRFYTKTFNPKTWPSGYTFQGYVYLPDNLNPKDGKVGTPVDRNEYVDQVEVITETLRGRSSPSLNSGNISGIVRKGFYNILDRADYRNEASNGYLWFKIEEHLWIATKEGSWTKEYKAIQVVPSYLRIGYASSGDMKKIENYLDSQEIPYEKSDDGYITTTVEVGADKKLSTQKFCNDLGVPCVDWASTVISETEELKQKITILQKELEDIKSALLASTKELEQEKKTTKTLKTIVNKVKELVS